MRTLRLWLLLALGVTPLLAGVTGKLAGRITDAQTGEPLPFANVVIEGTGLGAAADEDGYYTVLNVPPGTYTVTFSYLGYQDYQVKNVKIVVDQTTVLNAALQPEGVKVEEVVVTAKEPLVNPTATETKRTVDVTDLQNLPYTNFQAALSLQAGVTQPNVIRGGRTDEVAYYVDGMQVTSPLFGGFFVNVNTSAIQEMSLITGGYAAEYGQALSGIVNIVTREGGDRFSGGLNLRTNSILPTKYNTGYNVQEAYFGGSFSKDFRYFVSLYNESRDGVAGWNYVPNYPIIAAYENGTPSFRAYVDDFNNTLPGGNIPLPTLYSMAKYWQQWYKDHPYMLPHTKRNQFNYQAKLTLLPLKGAKFNLAFLGTVEQRERNYDQTYKFMLDQFRTDARLTRQITATWNHVVSDKFFYTVNVGYFVQRRGVGIKKKEFGFFEGLNNGLTFTTDWREWHTSRTVEPTLGFVQYHNMDYYAPALYSIDNPWGVRDIGVNFRQGGTYRVFSIRNEITQSLKADFTWQANRYHEVKTGLEFRRHHIQYYQNTLPYSQNPFYTDIDVTPFQAAAYIQDKMEYGGLISNIGIRLDYLDPNYNYFIDVSTIPPNAIIQFRPQDTIPKRAQGRWQVSPRFAFSFPVTERQRFHFFYGYFFQAPPLIYLYDATQKPITQVRGNEIVGNPVLDAERQISYEAGLATQLTENTALDVTAFYRDIYGWIGTREVKVLPQPFFIYTNADYGNVKGVEVTYQKRGLPLDYQLSYTFQIAKGTAADPYESYYSSYYQWYGRDPVTGEPLPVPHTAYPLSYDHTHTLVAQVNYRFTADRYPSVLLRDLTVSIVHRSQSGAPYTPRDLRGNVIGEPYSERMPWTHSTDLRMVKPFKISDRLSVEAFFEVLNLFNIKNVISVYEATGKPDDNGVQNTVSVADYPNTYRIGDRGYNPFRDLNGDGVLTPQEQYESYLMALKDYVSDPTNYDSPRVIRMGLQFRF